MKFALFTLALLLAGLAPHPALALTTGNSPYASTDGSLKLSDPDDALDEATTPGGQSGFSTLKFGDGNALRFGVQPDDGDDDNSSSGNFRSAIAP